jgi:hypothetical protein
MQYMPVSLGIASALSELTDLKSPLMSSSSTEAKSVAIFSFAGSFTFEMYPDLLIRLLPIK